MVVHEFVFFQNNFTIIIPGKEGLLRLYPDLAGKLAASGQLTSNSKKEHKAAGLDQLTQEEEVLMAILNEKYKNKFGFPFVICSRQNKKDSIINGLRERLNNTVEEEIVIGINEVKKICNIRLERLFED